MPARVHSEPLNIAKTITSIRISGGRMLRIILRPRKRLSALLMALLSAWIPQTQAVDGNALPTQGNIKVGSGQINQTGANMVINQNSPRLGVDWQTYNIGTNSSVTYVQPGREAVALNRVVGNEASQIYGRLTSNGQVFLVNPNGVLFAPGSKVDVGGIVASSLNLSQEDFAKGHYVFSGGDNAGKVSNQGNLNAASGGYVALFAPQVRNEGSIDVATGQVVLAGGRAVTVDITGSGLISAVVNQGAANSQVENSGTVISQGGSIRMTAKAAQDTVGGLINNSGIVKASTLVNKGDEIWLMGDGIVSHSGELNTSAPITQPEQTNRGGTISIEGQAVALGGKIYSDGPSGGQINVTTHNGALSLTDAVYARGETGEGGQIHYQVADRVLENSGSQTDVSGHSNGGRIQVEAERILSSGHYQAKGETGQGGQIDISATNSLSLLSAELNASGREQGGLIRIGGEYQGGKTPSGPVHERFVQRWDNLPRLRNSQYTLISSGSTLDVSATEGEGGTAIVWSDQQTTLLGQVKATGQTRGGAVEISSANDLRHADLSKVDIGTGGELLLDPKNITVIADDAVTSTSLLLETFGVGTADEVNDEYGSSVAISGEGNFVAVGAPGDDGFNNDSSNFGAVYIYQLASGNWSLLKTIGVGYVGSDDYDLASRVNTESWDNLYSLSNDKFGASVALNGDGTVLAVGATDVDAAISNGNSVATGAVYVFSSSGNSTAVKVIGRSNLANFPIDKEISDLSSGEKFGNSIALNYVGNQLAIGREEKVHSYTTTAYTPPPPRLPVLVQMGSVPILFQVTLIQAKCS